MSEPRKIELGGALVGRHVAVDRKALTLGFLEDMQSQDAKLILDALSAVIVGGDLPLGNNRAGLRKLNMDELQALIQGVMTGITDIPKSG